jgi:phosphatidylglycerol---prolipoprotein diacylglyceryl transferase
MVVDLNPILLSLGPLEIRWYGLMYVIAFVVGGVLAKKLCDVGFMQLAREKVDTMITYIIIGMFLGARLAYVFIYNWNYFSQRPLEIFYVWQGGLSFHGALAGILISCYFFSRHNKIPYAQTMDTIALAGAQGLFWGRIGNFINGELYGRVTDASIGMIFPAGGPFPRHPSQLYEAFAEGLLLTIILWLFLKRVRFYGILSSIFLAGYGFFRFIIEYFREPDAQLGYFFWGTTTMGQILCLIMIGVGVLAFVLARKKNDLVAINQS